MSTIATILALADGGQASDSVLKTALGVARKFEAHLDVLHLRADPSTLVPIVGEGMSGALVEQMIDSMTQAVESRAKRAREAYDRVAAEAPETTMWREVVGPGPDNVASAGRVTDLVVMARPSGEDSLTQTALLDAAIFDTGHPVMIVPAGYSAATGDNIVLCWNGTAQSARAVAAALPFLCQAKQVTVLTVGDEDKAAPAAALGAYLSRHKIDAEVIRLEAGGGPIGRALLDRIAGLSADMVVMGGYGHSRLKEMILGGTTRYVLSNAALPVLMAH
jgi:nucleotide-binding universal stress UspA family protein